jgi:hypothetical protein
MGFLMPLPYSGLSALASPFALPPPPPSPNALLAGVFSPTILGSPYPGAIPTLLELAAPTSQPTVRLWQYVRARFGALLDDIKVTAAQIEDGTTKRANVTACLNRHYWGVSCTTANSILIGSWGKATQIGGWYRSAPDVDLLFLLPGAVYHRFAARVGNRQSNLLQEVKEVLGRTFTQTTMRGDGQVVLIPFQKTTVEVVAGFRCTDGSIIYCDTTNGGSYKTSTGEAEQSDFAASDLHWNGNTCALARMMKRWRDEQNAALKSFVFERLAVEFLAQWAYSLNDVFYYDWMVRDFLSYLMGRANTHLAMPGTGELVWLGDDWLPRARAAHVNAVRACAYERDNYDTLAGNDWQAIFGTAIPARVS